MKSGRNNRLNKHLFGHMVLSVQKPPIKSGQVFDRVNSKVSEFPEEWLPTPSAPGMSMADIAKQLKRYRNNPEYAGIYRIPFAALAEYCGISRDSVYAAEQGDWLSNEVVHGLSHAIEDIKGRRVVFIERRGGKPDKEGLPSFIRLDPPKVTPRIHQWGREIQWTIHSHCTCGNNIFLPITLNGEHQVACYYCLPHDQYRSIGAIARKLGELAKTVAYQQLIIAICL